MILRQLRRAEFSVQRLAGVEQHLTHFRIIRSYMREVAEAHADGRCSSIELRQMYGLLAFLFAAYSAIQESYILRRPSAVYDRRT